MENRRFKELLDAFEGRRVLVVGDCLLDEYTIGDTKRVSREAPVIVVDYRESRFHPGGAANAVQNVASLGGSALVCGAVGADREGRILRDILAEKGAAVDGLVESTEVATSVKTRILAGELHAQKQQIARVDRTRSVPPTGDTIDALVERCRQLTATVDAVVISDYGLGVTASPVRDTVIDACRRKGTPTVVDSRFRLMEFAGATTAVPNEVELVESVPADKRPAEALAAAVVSELELDGLIVTRGSQGMSVVMAGGEVNTIGIVGSRDVADVTGAGDTVAAAVALSLASGGTLTEAAEMATYAAAVVVMKRGTATVDRTEMEELRAEYPTPELP